MWVKCCELWEVDKGLGVIERNVERECRDWKELKNKELVEMKLV